MRSLILILALRWTTSVQATPPQRLFSIRGGSTKPAQDPDLHAYRLQQQLYLQSRSLRLRQALLQRGLTELQHSESTETVAQIVDWDCALATRAEPKSCLYSFDAQEGSKVICPIHTNQWITLAALNRLRRNDPTKVEPLWHTQYQILNSWFHPQSSFSLYTHLTPIGTLLACLLDAPWLLASTMLLTLTTAVLLTLPVWEGLVVKRFLTSPLLWLQWHQWGRFVHAALPLKLLLGQMAWKAVATAFGAVYGNLRGRLVEWECQLLEDCTPLTVLPGMRSSSREEELASADEEEFESAEEEEFASADDEEEFEVEEEEEEFEDEEETDEEEF